MATPAIRRVVDRRLWIYAGGVAATLFVRSAPLSRSVRMLVVAAVLAGMVLTYAAELWLRAGDGVRRPLSLSFGVVGVAAGLWLVLTGTLAGVLFVGGGLLFFRRGIAGGESA
ncbi:hypothetical protein [Halococcus sp. PRR34]|uniref:hypothetical protein n=1 Tax=Halococcus sp. PRR34 TaxID=3020830 RepID=UPI00236160DB|nr:hypothetical protein [Halococcus sp. PRR34]